MDLGELDPHMARCFELAWQSCAAGTIGVGARLVGDDGAVLADGSNGLFAEPVGPLHGNKIAHAEMNALAQIDAAADWSLSFFDRAQGGENPYAVQFELQEEMQRLVGIARVENELLEAGRGAVAGDE